jgi:hypothetical protein
MAIACSIPHPSRSQVVASFFPDCPEFIDSIEAELMERAKSDPVARWVAFAITYNLQLRARALLVGNRLTCTLNPFADSLEREESERFFNSLLGEVSNPIEEWLRELLSLVALEECNDWATVKREIIYSYIASDYVRAANLFSLLDHLPDLNPDEAQCLRAQFRFLTSFQRRLTANLNRLSLEVRKAGEPITINTGMQEPELEIYGELNSLLWPPDVWEPKKIRYALLAALCIADNLRQDGRNVRIDEVGRALSDLQKAAAISADKNALYLPMIGYCALTLGDRELALKSFRQLPASGNRWFAGGSYFCKCCFLKIAGLSEASGQLSDAEELLLAWVEDADDPANKREMWMYEGMYTRLARIRFAQNDLQGAFKFLQLACAKEPRHRPQFERELLLAIPNTTPDDDSDKMAEHMFESNPEMSHGLQSIMRSQWGRFGLLCEAAQREWIFALYGHHIESQKHTGIGTSMQQWAGVAFAKAVELELRDKVFFPFREFVLKNEALRALALGDLAHEEAKELCRFILEKPEITLGQMGWAMKVAGRSRSALLKRFGTWLGNNCRELMNRCTKFKICQKQKCWKVHIPWCKENMPHLGPLPIDKELGSGHECIYMWYNESDAKNAKRSRKAVWPCKIGRTTGKPDGRIIAQGAATAFANVPVIALVLQTDDSRNLETMIHAALRYAGGVFGERSGSEQILERSRAYSASLIAQPGHYKDHARESFLETAT